MNKKSRIIYIVAVICITAIMIYLVTIKQYMFIFTYVNTLIGVCVWLVFVIKNRDYPMNSITLAIFVIKLIADIFAFIVYYDKGNLIEKAMCILLPVVHSLFVLLFFKRKKYL